VSTQDRLNLIHTLGLDRSLFAQYWTWLSHFVTGQWGTSLLSHRSVAADIKNALANSLILGLSGVALSLVFGIAIGIFSAVRQYSIGDHLATGAAFLGLSMPSFWLALLLQLLFGVYLTRWFHLTSPIFYISGMTKPGTEGGFHLVDRLQHLALPVLVLAVQLIAVYSRYMRASLLEVLHSDYMRTAKAKGIRPSRALLRHGVRNSLSPVTTQLALDIGAIIGGLIIIEQVFQWPGMGTFFIKAMNAGDYPQVLAWLMVVAGAVIVMNLLADIAYALLDPRVRHE
jgi:peptide/nickel transport system permease protein